MMRAFEAELSGKGFGTTFTAITGKDLRQFLAPLPPLAEQKRIVAKVESLLALCDALAEEVAAAEEVRARLLQAVLNGG
jgi:type I restriction enzyme S subunit